ncbi:histidinol-phosphatase [Bhargavaea cecembensis]|uniref:Histidinol-phosphatase n=1 Tax=Bhargavaea cecembensis TaxID=394098 RepID=A0A161SIX5_9BACL|nr:PHP domain-containing protein [Bhargavaea cecembensis]KZE37133.1 histidinol-phosphatase [Bhargavaea cecembensis]
MIIDFHTHVKLSKKSPFMPDYFRQMMAEAKESGLTAIALTEHFNTTRWEDIYDFLDAEYPYRSGHYEAEGMKVFPGIEVDVRENGHVLLVGGREEIRAIRAALEGHLTEGNFIPFEGLMDLAEARDMLKIGGHPFRDSTPLALNVPAEQLKRLDALDLNGKDLHVKGPEVCRREVQELSYTIGVPVVGGSDTHQFLQYGTVKNHFDDECENSDDLKKAIAAWNYRIDLSDQLDLKVRAATLVKKYMKQCLEEKEVISL